MTLPQFKRELRRLTDEIARLPEEQRYPRYCDAVKELPGEWREVGEAYLTTFIVMGYNHSAKDPNLVVQAGGVVQIGRGPMSNTTNTQNISGGNFSGPVGVNQAFQNCYNVVQQVADPTSKKALEDLIATVEKIQPQLSEADKPRLERKLKLLTDEAAQGEPDKEQLAVSGKGIIETVKDYAEAAPAIILAVKAVAGCFGFPIP